MNIHLEPAAISALKMLSEKEQRSPDAIINDLILARNGDIDPRIIAALDVQMAQFKATGEACDWDEVEAWMLSWFTDSERPEPQFYV